MKTVLTESKRSEVKTRMNKTTLQTRVRSRVLGGAQIITEGSFRLLEDSEFRLLEDGGFRLLQ